MAFKQKTIDQVILPLIDKLSQESGKVYPTLGHFYRVIELLKFPYLDYRNTERNVYTQSQYDSILEYCIVQGFIKLKYDTKRRAYNVIIQPIIDFTLPIGIDAKSYAAKIAESVKATLFSSLEPQITVPVFSAFPGKTEYQMKLTQESKGSNVYELSLPAGEGLSSSELKALNKAGFVYYSEQTDIDFETENGIEYMDIFYFSKVENTQKLFANQLPF